MFFIWVVLYFWCHMFCTENSNRYSPFGFFFSSSLLKWISFVMVWWVNLLLSFIFYFSPSTIRVLFTWQVFSILNPHDRIKSELWWVGRPWGVIFCVEGINEQTGLSLHCYSGRSYIPQKVSEPKFALTEYSLNDVHIYCIPIRQANCTDV